MTINVDANLFRVIALCQSNEEARYYLCGVFVEPHANGVTMTATDGHVLLSVHDDTGSCSAPCIVALSKDALRACKTGKKEYTSRRVFVGDDNKAFVRALDADVAVTPNAIVDGIFPDWRHIIPASPTEGKAATFDQAILRTMCDVAREFDTKGITIMGGSDGGAALVRFAHKPFVFGVAMPMRNEERQELPSWFHLPLKTAA